GSERGDRLLLGGGAIDLVSHSLLLGIAQQRLPARVPDAALCRVGSSPAREEPVELVRIDPELAPNADRGQLALAHPAPDGLVRDLEAPSDLAHAEELRLRLTSAAHSLNTLSHN